MPACLDLSLIGGPNRFLEAARMFSARGLRVGSHVFAYHSSHLLGCVPGHLPAEVLNWWDTMFTNTPQPQAGLLPVLGPGFGLTPDDDYLAAHGETLATIQIG